LHHPDPKRRRQKEEASNCESGKPVIPWGFSAGDVPGGIVNLDSDYFLQSELWKVAQFAGYELAKSLERIRLAGERKIAPIFIAMDFDAVVLAILFCICHPSGIPKRSSKLANRKIHPRFLPTNK
jgi:hypothetical protein